MLEEVEEQLTVKCKDFSFYFQMQDCEQKNDMIYSWDHLISVLHMDQGLAYFFCKGIR